MNPDNLTIGENLRAAQAKQSLSWTTLAEQAGLADKTVLSRAVAGRAGLSEEKLIKLAELLGVHPGTLIAGTTQRAREDRFPNIPSPANRNQRDRASKGMATSRVESLLMDTPQANAMLSHFFGGVHPSEIPKFRAILTTLHKKAAEKRAAAIAAGTFDPATGKFKG